MDRRTFLATSLAWGLSSSLAGARQHIRSSGSVTSEYGKLKRVLVHPPGAETQASFPMFLGGHSMLTWELLRDEARSQHAALVKQLAECGVEVLLLADQLKEALAHARQQGSFGDWLATAAPPLVPHQQDITADTLLGRDDRFVFRRDSSGALSPAISPTTTLFFARDLAVMTPRGVVVGNFNSYARAFEATLTRFLFEHAAALNKYPVVFDAVRERVFIQGGDVLVADENTLFIGVGNATQEVAAIRLAQRLEMDVITVRMPSAKQALGAWEGLRMIFYHLDCLLNIVDRGKVLAVPYLLEKDHARENPLLDVLYGFARIEGVDRIQRTNMLDEVRSVGWIRRYQAGSGDRDTTLGELKLLDYLKAIGYDVTFVGGALQAGGNELKYVVERVIRECRFMAPNVVAVEPAHVIGYEGNKYTRAALQQSGIQVTTFPSHELVRANGGPRCLTLPLERS